MACFSVSEDPKIRAGTGIINPTEKIRKAQSGDKKR
jgi:hypothetical protein